MQGDFDILATIARRLFTESRATAIDRLGRRVVFGSPLESIRQYPCDEAFVRR
jgi:hypothetical protein